MKSESNAPVIVGNTLKRVEPAAWVSTPPAIPVATVGARLECFAPNQNNSPATGADRARPINTERGSALNIRPILNKENTTRNNRVALGSLMRVNAAITGALYVRPAP
jgi:hypothetical protein